MKDIVFRTTLLRFAQQDTRLSCVVGRYSCYGGYSQHHPTIGPPFLLLAVELSDMQFALLGTANIARHQFVPAIRQTDHEVVAVASREEARARSFADDLGVPDAYGSYDEMLSTEGIDAVYNPLPNALHAEWTKRAADEGVHILCEKPLAVTAEEAVEMGAYCRERDVTLMEAVMYRYHPRTERTVEIVGDELGDIRTMATAFHSSFSNWPAGFRYDPELGGGCLLDVGVYAISAARLFLGEPKSVFGVTVDREDSGVDTQATALLEFPDGATATISASFDNVDVQYYRLEGEQGWLSVDPAFAFGDDYRPSVEYGVDGRRTIEEFDAINHYVREIEHFASCVEEGKRPRTDATEAARTLAVVDSIRESATTGEPAPVESPE